MVRCSRGSGGDGTAGSAAAAAPGGSGDACGGSETEATDESRLSSVGAGAADAVLAALEETPVCSGGGSPSSRGSGRKSSPLETTTMESAATWRHVLGLRSAPQRAATPRAPSGYLFQLLYLEAVHREAPRRHEWLVVSREFATAAVQKLLPGVRHHQQLATGA